LSADPRNPALPDPDRPILNETELGECFSALGTVRGGDGQQLATVQNRKIENRKHRLSFSEGKASGPVDFRIFM
jgi:hypothetical protein